MAAKNPRGLSLDGDTLRRLRKAKHWDQIRLAVAAVVNVATIGRAEAGKSVSRENAKSIADALDADLDSLLPSQLSSRAAAISNIAIRIPRHFFGRDEAMKEIEAAMNRYAGRVAITALHGLRGVGKSVLAAAYADRHSAEYRASWWINAETEVGLRSGLVALGIRLNWVAAGAKEDEVIPSVLQRLRDDGAGILLIYDNVRDSRSVRTYLPRGGAAQVLITSTAHDWGAIAEPVEIRLWPMEIGADYLLARTNWGDQRQAAEALSNALGGLPLAHEQAAAYCERLGVSFAEYLRRFEVAPVKLLDDQRHAPVEYHDGRTVARTYALAIEEAKKEHPAAESLIVHAAFLAPVAIPLFLFEDGQRVLADPLASALVNDELEEIIATLRSFALVDQSLIEYRDGKDTFFTNGIRLHRLVREVAAMRADQEDRAALAALAAAFPSDAYRNVGSWQRCAALAPHVLAACANETRVPEETAEFARLLNSAGGYFFETHEFPSFSHECAFKRALMIREKLLGPDHPDTATSLNNLGASRYSKGARPLYERALVIYERELGDAHPDTMTILNNLCMLFRNQLDYTAARPLYERALAIYERELGPYHPDTAMVYNELQALTHSQGDAEGSRRYLRRLLEIYDQLNKCDPPDAEPSLDELMGYATPYRGGYNQVPSLVEECSVNPERKLGCDES